MRLSDPVAGQSGRSVDRKSIEADYDKLPLRFEPNVGQADADVKFVARGPGYAFLLTGDEADLALPRRSDGSKTTPAPAVVRMRLSKANTEAHPPGPPGPTGIDPLPGKSNYFTSSDVKKWHANVLAYSRVRYEDVYPGVDLIFYGNRGNIEYDFVVRPGADPAAIDMILSGEDTGSAAQRFHVDAKGDIVAAVANQKVRFHKPLIYQSYANGKRHYLDGSYELRRNVRYRGKKNTGFGFRVPAYDHRKALVIDPILSYSTYLGIGNTTEGNAIAVDSAGNAYVTGYTMSLNFVTTPGAFQTMCGGGCAGGTYDAFVTKLNTSGSAAIYSTYLGGSKNDSGEGIALDAAGDAYVTGSTYSNDFPVTAGAFQTTYTGKGEAFVTELNPTGSGLNYSTYLGGTGFAQGNAIALDGSGNAYITGWTNSGSFPTTHGAFQTAYGGGQFDAFVTKLNPTGSALVYSTLLGGNQLDVAYAIALDASGDAYVTGPSESSNFPTTSGAYQTVLKGPSAAFISELNPSGTGLVLSTLLGGSGTGTSACPVCSTSIALDAQGDIYVAGLTWETTFPTTPGAVQTVYAGGFHDAFITELNPLGSALVYSTYLGGKSDDGVVSIALDSSNDLYLRGNTFSNNFPVTPGAFQTTFGGASDAFFAELNPAGTSLLYSTYLGGSGSEFGGATKSLALDAQTNPNVYVTGYSASTNFPVTQGALQTTYGGGSYNAFITKFGLGPDVSTSPSTLTFGNEAVGSTSSAQNVTLTNTGNSTLNISDIVSSANFSETNTCGASLAAGSSCTVSVTFTPGAEGTLNGTLTMTDNAVGNPQTVSLSGTGVAPLVSLSPASLSFSTQQVGTSSNAQAVTLTNSGNAALSVSSLSTGADYTQTNNCGGSVAAGASCTINVTFTPTTTGMLNESLSIADNAAGSPQTVSLTGTGTAPAVSLTPSSLTFGPQQVSASSNPQSVTLANTGTATLTLSSIIASGDFSETNTCGSSVAAGASCTISVIFTPTATGTRSGTVTVSDNATGSPQTVSLTGTGTAPAVSLFPGSLMFGTEFVGFSSAPQTVTLTNTGTATLSISGVSMGPDFGQTNNCGSAVAAGASCSFTVTFTPTTAGTLNESLTVTDNAAGSPQSVSLTGTGVLAVPAVSLTPPSLAFPDQTVGSTSSSQSSTLTNTGNAALSITSIVASGDFALVSTGSSCPYAGGLINPGATCTIDVTFTPTATGTRTGAATITDNAPNSPQSLGLSGTGLSAPSGAVPEIDQPVVPASAAPGSSGITLTVNGAGFDSTSLVNWNGAALTTNFVSNRQLTATVPASDLASAMTASITVTTPAPGGSVSNVVFFPVTNPTATLSFRRADLAVGNGPRSIVTSDFNRDGKPDLAAVNNLDGTVTVLLGNGGGTFNTLSAFAVGSSPVAAATGDLNGDGIPDLVVANNGNNSVSVLLGNGDGTFTAGTPVAPGNGPSAVALADMNGDGWLDLIAANAADTAIAVLLGNGDGTFGPPAAFNTGSGPQSMVTADFNNDGILDVATANNGDGTVSILLGNGDGTFAPQSVFSAGHGLDSIAAADLNGDGNVDLAVANSIDNTVSILLGNGSGTFTVGAAVATGNAPAAVALADLNGDGILDLAVANATDNTVATMLGNGDGTFQAGATFASAAGPASLTIADFNNDGRIDLATADQGAADVSILLQGPVVNLSPSSLSFGNQAVGSSSAPQTVTLANTGSAALTIASITTGPDYTQTNTCGTSLAAGANCTITVAFAPTASGALNESLTITDNAANSPESISLTGTGTAPAATLSPQNLTFPSQQVGTSSSPQAVTLTNTGNATLTITGISGTGTNSGDFSESSTCSATLTAGSSCSINVTFRPTAGGTRVASLSVSDNATGSPQTVALSGTGTAPAVTLSPSKLTFAAQPIKTTSAVQTVTLTNTGTATLTLNSITLTGSNSGDFAETNNCGSSLAAGASCSISVTFTPTASGTRVASLSIGDNASGSPQKVSLLGTGTVMTVSPNSLNFGSVNVGSTSTPQTVTITNTGTSSVTIKSITKSGADPKDFNITSNNCGSTLGASASCTVTLTFKPGASGSRTANLDVSDTGGGSPQIVALSGTGT